MKLSAEDRLDILQLMARYSWAADTNDAAGFASVYAKDAVVQFRDAKNPNVPTTVAARSRDELARGLATNYALRAGGQHHTHNHIIVIEDGLVKHRCFWSLVIANNVGKLETLGMGAYEDELTKDPTEGWLLAKRTIVANFPAA